MLKLKSNHVMRSDEVRSLESRITINQVLEIRLRNVNRNHFLFVASGIQNLLKGEELGK